MTDKLRPIAGNVVPMPPPPATKADLEALERKIRADFYATNGKTLEEETRSSRSMLGLVLACSLAIGVALLAICLALWMAGPLLEAIRLNGKVEFHG